jgi:hypothetical protein
MAHRQSMTIVINSGWFTAGKLPQLTNYCRRYTHSWRNNSVFPADDLVDNLSDDLADNSFRPAVHSFYSFVSGVYFWLAIVDSQVNRLARLAYQLLIYDQGIVCHSLQLFPAFFDGYAR